MKFFFPAAAAVAIAAATISICHQIGGPTPVAVPPPPVVAASVVQSPPVAKPVSVNGELEGRLEAGSQVEIRPQLDGYSVRLKAAAGDFVQKGQLLVELGDSKLEDSVKSAEAGLRLVKAEFQAYDAQAAKSKAGSQGAGARRRRSHAAQPGGSRG